MSVQNFPMAIGVLGVLPGLFRLRLGRPVRRLILSDDAESGEARRDWRIRTDRAADLEVT